MSNAEVWAAFIGVLVPMLVGVLTKLETSSKVKGILAGVLSVLAGVGLAVANGQFSEGFSNLDVPTILKYIAIIAVAAQTAYNMFIKPSGIASFLQQNVGFTSGLKGNDNY